MTMPKAPKTTCVEFIRETIVGGRSHRIGEVVKVRHDTARQLFRECLAIPYVGQGREPMNAAFNQTDIRPFCEEAQT